MLTAESMRQRARRGTGCPANGHSAPLAPQLRAMGAAFDEAGVARCTVTVGHEEIIGLTPRGDRFAYPRARPTWEFERAAYPGSRPITCPVCDEPRSLVPLGTSGGEIRLADLRATHRCRSCFATVQLVH